MSVSDHSTDTELQQIIHSDTSAGLYEPQYETGRNCESPHFSSLNITEDDHSMISSKSFASDQHPLRDFDGSLEISLDINNYPELQAQSLPNQPIIDNRDFESSHDSTLILGGEDINEADNRIKKWLRKRKRHFSTRKDASVARFLDTARGIDFQIRQRPQNIVEAQRMTNNHMFGFRKWYSNITNDSFRSRSTSESSNEDSWTKRASWSSKLSNVLYVCFIGWWLAMLYGLLGCIMYSTYIGRQHGAFCFTLSSYCWWPFGKFMHKTLLLDEDQIQSSLPGPLNDKKTYSENSPLVVSVNEELESTTTTILGVKCRPLEKVFLHKRTGYWKKPGTYIWLIIGFPILSAAHILAFLLSWLPVVSIPVAKSSVDPSSGVLIYIHQAVNPYYYKYSVENINIVILNSMIILLPLTLGFGYGDPNHDIINELPKFVLAIMSIVPLSYCISLGISSLSAQTSPAVGAFLNATFGTVVDVIMGVTALVKGYQDQQEASCFEDMVKAGLVGTLLSTTLLIPGISMLVGGFKHKTQRFNMKSAGVTATLLFVAVIGVFAPSIFTKMYAVLSCEPCKASSAKNITNILHPTVEDGDKECMECAYVMPGEDFYDEVVKPLVFVCVILLPLAYIVGLIFSLRTHRDLVYDIFKREMQHTAPKHSPIWGKLKSAVIMSVTILLVALCSDLLIDNVEPLLSGTSVYVIGVTLFAVMPQLPEIVIGIQFALQNDIALSIEVGSCIAVQVCMLQVPILVLTDLLFPIGFSLIFSDIHIWSALFGVLMMNYIYQDGKSDYFQGSAMVLAYLILIATYFFTPVSNSLECDQL